MTPTYKPVRSQSSGVQSSVISALHCGVPYFFVTSFQLVCHSRIRRSGGLSSIQVTSINTVLIDIVFPFWFWLTNQAFDCFIRLSHFRIRCLTIRRSALLSLIPVIWINSVITEIISVFPCGDPYVFVTSITWLSLTHQAFGWVISHPSYFHKHSTHWHSFFQFHSVSRIRRSTVSFDCLTFESGV